MKRLTPLLALSLYAGVNPLPSYAKPTPIAPTARTIANFKRLKFVMILQQAEALVGKADNDREDNFVT